jgi:hypothetical protein
MTTTHPQQGNETMNGDTRGDDVTGDQRTPLLPCPFCGSAAKFTGRVGGQMGKITCTGDDCFGPMTTATYKDDSIAQWNRRATTAAPGSPVMTHPTTPPVMVPDHPQQEGRGERERLAWELEQTYVHDGFIYGLALRENERDIIIDALRSISPTGDSEAGSDDQKLAAAIVEQYKDLPLSMSEHDQLTKLRGWIADAIGGAAIAAEHFGRQATLRAQPPQPTGARVNLPDDHPFRYLSPEPAPHELGISADYEAPLDLRTTSEMMADRDAKRTQPTGDVGELVERLLKRRAFFANGATWMMSPQLDDDCTAAADLIVSLNSRLAEAKITAAAEAAGNETRGKMWDDLQARAEQAEQALRVARERIKQLERDVVLARQSRMIGESP